MDALRRFKDDADLVTWALSLGIPGVVASAVTLAVNALHDQPPWLLVVLCVAIFFVGFALAVEFLPRILASVRKPPEAAKSAAEGRVQTITTDSYIEHVHTLNLTIHAPGGREVSIGSNYVFRSPDFEGPLVPRGTIFQEQIAGQLVFSGALHAAVTDGSGDVSFVPPEVLNRPPFPPDDHS